MCSICLQNPCHPRCPNAPDPVPAAYCRECGEPMYEGDREFDGVCEECLKDFSVSEWLDLFGEKLSTITKEDDGWKI